MRVPGYIYLLRAKDRIDRDFAQPLDTEALATVARSSRWHFVRSFTRAFGVTPGRYLQQRRIERAAQLLRSTDLSVTDVCMEVGFSSLGSFSSTFSQLQGESPTLYRARHRETPAAVPDCFSMMWTRPEVSNRGEAEHATD